MKINILCRKVFGAVAEDLLGIDVSNAGDFNGDGVDDILIGASGSSSNGKTVNGVSYILFGSKISFSDIDLSVTSLSSTGQGFKVTARNKL